MAKYPDHVSTALGRHRPQHESLIEMLYLAVLGRKPDVMGMIDYSTMIIQKPEYETLIAITRSLAHSEEASDFRQHLKSVHG